MAWAERLPGGKWRGGWRDTDDKKCYTKKSTHPEHPYRLKSDALEAAKEAEVKAARQAATTTGTLSASTHWGVWWDLIKNKRVTDDTSSDQMELNTAERYLRPRWEKTPLNGIKHKKVQDWLDDWADGKIPEWKHRRKPAPSSVRRSYAVFRWSIQLAVKQEILDASPCAGIKLPKVSRKRKAHLSVEDAPVIGQEMREDYRDFMDFEHETGLRPSELAGLHAASLDRRRKLLTVRDVYVASKKVIRSSPKDSDDRVVPLTEKALAIFDKYTKGRNLKAGCGIRHSDESKCRSALVFLTKHGKPIHPTVYYRHLKEAAESVDVPAMSPYAVRRGAATRLADGGADPFAIKDFMGHSTMDQTDEYVQQTEQRLATLRAALGDRNPLTVVEGGKPAEPDPETREASG